MNKIDVNNYDIFEKKTDGLKKKVQYFEKRYGKTVTEWVRKLKSAKSIKIADVDVFKATDAAYVESIEWVPLSEEIIALKVRFSRAFAKFMFDAKFLLINPKFAKSETWSVKNAFGQRMNSLRSVLFFGQSKGFIKSFTFQPGNLSLRTNEDKKIPILEPKSDILLHVLDDETKAPLDDKRIWAELDTIHIEKVPGKSIFFNFEQNKFEYLEIQKKGKKKGDAGSKRKGDESMETESSSVE